MTDPSSGLALEDFAGFARTVRSEYGDSASVVGKCDYACYALQDLLRVEAGVPREAVDVQEMRIGPAGEENHYICVIDPEYVSGCTGPLWVDMTLDQFCDENVERGAVEVSLGPSAEIDRVMVMPPGDDRREVYQDTVEWIKEKLG